MDSVDRVLNSPDIDDITKAEIRHDVEVKLKEYHKFSGQISRDLRRIGGEYAFQDANAYAKLRAKYRTAHAGRKKLAILDIMQRKWTNREENS